MGATGLPVMNPSVRIQGKQQLLVIEGETLFPSTHTCTDKVMMSSDTHKTLLTN